MTIPKHDIEAQARLLGADSFLREWKPLPAPTSKKSEAIRAWDYWYAHLPADLKRKLSVNDFKRLGDLLVQAFTKGVQ